MRNAILACIFVTAAWPNDVAVGLRSPVARFEVVDVSFEEALRNLALQVRPNAVIGFEPAIVEPRMEAPKIRVTVRVGTASDVLAQMCAADRRYTYSETAAGVIEVRATDEPAEVRILMNLPVPNLDLKVRDWPPNLFSRISEVIPELGAYLHAKTQAWSKETGRLIPGTPGMTMTSNVIPPEVSIHVENATVRGVLNSIAAYTLTHDSPTGWRVAFTPDPAAPTGLGGYVRWSAFP